MKLQVEDGFYSSLRVWVEEVDGSDDTEGQPLSSFFRLSAKKMEANHQYKQSKAVVSYQRKGQKRKLLQEEQPSFIVDMDLDADVTYQTFVREAKSQDLDADVTYQTIDREAKSQVEVMENTYSWRESDRLAAKRDAHILAEMAKEGLVGLVVEVGAVAVVVKHVEEPPSVPAIDGGQRCLEFEVEKECAIALDLVAVKPKHQHIILDAGALTLLVNILKRHKNSSTSRALCGLLRRAANTLTNLAHENSGIRTYMRIEDGNPPLVKLLEHMDPKVQKSAVGALRTLTFKNDENKNQIVECNALPTLILILRSEDVAMHYEAVGVIGNLVHSSPSIKKEVLAEGDLQPVIGLLSSSCTESQREATLFLG